MKPMLVNLACGEVFVDSPQWVNLDVSPTSPAVRKADLLQPLPVGSATAAMVYSSHFLEHIPRSLVPGFLKECHRILKDGGLLRLVLPDFEVMARSYLSMREAADHGRADFIAMLITDQCVRREPGGELGRFYRDLRTASDADDAMLDFVRDYTGEDLRTRRRRIRTGRRDKLKPSFMMRSMLETFLKLRLHLPVSMLPAVFREQNVSFADIGERHHWNWDLHQLRQVLHEAGFESVARRSATESAMKDFPFHPLDIDSQGSARKGAHSMYVEAVKSC